MSQHERPSHLMSLPSYVAGHVSRIGNQSLVEHLGSLGLRLPHFAVLCALDEFGALPQFELASHLRLNRSHLVGYLDLLEQESLVVRERDGHDRRKQTVLLTQAGAELSAELQSLSVSMERAALQVLSDTELATLTALLQKVVAGEA